MLMVIREKRKEMGLTQTELAIRAGVSQSTIAAWETEVYLPRVRDLPLLAKVFGCTISELFQPEAAEAS